VPRLGKRFSCGKFSYRSHGQYPPTNFAATDDARGLLLEAYIQEILAQVGAPCETRRPLTQEDIRAWLDSLAQFSDKDPGVAQDDFARVALSEPQNPLVDTALASSHHKALSSTTPTTKIPLSS
jgi:hypothetical protein